MPDRKTASAADKAYFSRVAEKNQALPRSPPASLQEAFDSLDRMADQLGSDLVHTSQATGDGDLASHLAYLKRLRALDPHYRTRNT